jgi:hypothetical protein
MLRTCNGKGLFFGYNMPIISDLVGQASTGEQLYEDWLITFTTGDTTDSLAGYLQPVGYRNSNEKKLFTSITGYRSKQQPGTAAPPSPSIRHNG